MFTRSPREVSAGRTSISCLVTGTDSPVMADSSAFRFAHSKIRASAGTRSPASSWIISPGTSRAVSSRTSSPFRITLARGADILRRASSAFSALSSWEMEMQALTTTMSRMMRESIQSSPPLAARESTAAASSTRIMGSFICPSKRVSRPSCLCCSSSLRPCLSMRLPASVLLRPVA
ncbi:hypothetical protein SDC9_112172 [bioreactor metagenome]|uniref:Uncharacterized protein n=1 Tax=bioreactor metagenome TaxID=1076179 RepID=A0A645BIT6_9ZZZZ